MVVRTNDLAAHLDGRDDLLLLRRAADDRVGRSRRPPRRPTATKRIPTSTSFLRATSIRRSSTRKPRVLRPDGSWSSSASTYYFLTDANYNVTALLNSSGGSSSGYVYSAYGTATVYSPDYSTSYSASSYNNTVLFAGMWFDPTTGLARTSTRWYDTVIDTFMTSDPAQQGTNWYEYSGDDPADETDPTGLVTNTPVTGSFSALASRASKDTRSPRTTSCSRSVPTTV